jgi:hypothetical protein
LGLKAEPRADAALPGVSGALALPQLWFGWPVRCVVVDFVVTVGLVVVAALVAAVGVEAVGIRAGAFILNGARAIGGPASAVSERLADARKAVTAAVIRRGFIAHSL